jgi:hypothetical protein
MDAIEPNWVSSLWFAAFATICAIAFLVVAGMFPLRARSDVMKSPFATLLAIGNAALLAVMLLGTGFYGYTELKWTTLVIVAGLVVLFTPGLFETLPSPLRDGKTGLLVLIGVQMLTLAALAKIAGSPLANMS